MDAQRYAEVKRVFREAIRWAPEEREAVIAALAEDEAVRAEVRSLLAHHEEEAEEAAAEEASVGGRTLAALLREERAGGAAAGWAPERVMRTLEPIARALEELGERGGVHGAVRADRVTLSEAGAALGGGPAVDGLGDAADSMRRVATLPWIDRAAAATAAPEQLLPSLGPTGPWTDVYALALLCVELMLGRPATEGTAAAALTRARDEAAQPTPRAVGLAVPAAVEAVLARALAMRPMERYQDVRRFWAALRASLPAEAAGKGGPGKSGPESDRPSSSSSSATPVPKLPRAAERRLRRRMRAIFAAVLLVLAAIIVAILRFG